MRPFYSVFFKLNSIETATIIKDQIHCNIIIKQYFINIMRKTINISHEFCQSRANDSVMSITTVQLRHTSTYYNKYLIRTIISIKKLL